MLAAGIAVGALLTCVLVCLSPSRVRAAVAGVGTAAVGAFGLATGVATIAGGFTAARVDWLLPLTGARFAADGLSAWLLVVIGSVAVAAGVFTVGYARALPVPAWSLAALPVFVAAMLGVPLAGSVATFLLMWELMAVASLLLVLAEHRHRTVRDAGLMYAVMTHLSFVAVLLGLVVFAAAAHSGDFPALAAAHLSPAARTVVFLATVVGFGTKAGLLPLHAWLPRAHPESPSFASALMSAAMVALGIYGLLRVDVQLLGRGPRWWGLVLVIVGAGTAVYAVLQASVATDLKRLLAYSTSENMGLITLALGAGMLLTSSGNGNVAAVAFTAALLHVAAHAAFKTLGFLAAGSVLAATGTRDLDALGGLARPMPATTLLFGIAALGAAGLPLGAGFVSEWLLLQSLIHAPAGSGVLLPLVMPLGVGAVALTTGLGVATMVKAFGVGFLARPRGAGARTAREVGAAMQLAMATAAAACGVIAVAPAVLAPWLRPALAALTTDGRGALPSLGLLLRLPGIPGSMSPALLAAVVVGGVAVALSFTAARARGRPVARTAPLWACGTATLTGRMQYTATSFAEPLQRVFHDVLQPQADITVTPAAESRHLIEAISYRSRVIDTFETRLYAPTLRLLGAAAGLVRRAHNGSVHAYLGYGAVALLVLLVVAR
jgi:formate hydrogenlyase subunit 3/multisubunit Na+/H+ antiporter MnhD subunit